MFVVRCSVFVNKRFFLIFLTVLTCMISFLQMLEIYLSCTQSFKSLLSICYNREVSLNKEHKISEKKLISEFRVVEIPIDPELIKKHMLRGYRLSWTFPYFIFKALSIAALSCRQSEFCFVISLPDYHLSPITKLVLRSSTAHSKHSTSW